MKRFGARIRVIRGKHCPWCGARTHRIRSPWFFRPVRLLLRHRSSTRLCPGCGWWGLALHRRR